VKHIALLLIYDALNPVHETCLLAQCTYLSLRRQLRSLRVKQ